MLANELSGDRAFEHIRWLSHWHRDSGTEGFFKAAEYVVQAAKEAGLTDVKFVDQPMEGPNYTAKSAELWLTEPDVIKLADLGDHAVVLADGSYDSDIAAELIWVGDVSKEAVQKMDVRGKVVLTDQNAYLAVLTTVRLGGALGVLSFQTSENRSPLDYPDQVAWKRIPSDTTGGKLATFAFSLSPRQGENLKRLLLSKDSEDWFATGKKTPGGRAVVKATVDTEFGPEPGKTGFVEGWIRGSKYHDQQIVLTAHLQEEQGSANDDGSGCANLLELARTLNKLIAEGKMQRPLRDIRFWWTDEIYSEYRYFADFPDEPKKFLVNLHQDMTGAKYSAGDRKQHLIFAPQSATSYLDAIFESVATYVIHTNNPYLAAGRSGPWSRPHSRGIYSTRGSRENYRAEFVPYFGSSDNMCFVEGVIGVPSVAMINWDDPYIHSSDDDLWQIDQTELKRNNFIIATMARYLGSAGVSDVSTIASETFAQGQKRMANDMMVALQTIGGSDLPKENAWKDAAMIIEQGAQRERRALASCRIFVDGDRNATAIVSDFSAQVTKVEKEMMVTLEKYFVQVAGKKPSGRLSATENASSKKTPHSLGSLADYFDKRRNASAKTSLHAIMRQEVYNFVDGKRTYYDIYKAVRSEALTCGTWYYGTVTLEDVTSLLDAAVESGALSLK